LVLLLVLMFSVAHSDIAPFTTQPAYAAGRILCVNVTGGQTTAPCSNRTAFRHIQEAVDAAPEAEANEIRIAAGVYTGTPGTPADAAVFIDNYPLFLYGGFENGDWSTSVTSTTTVIDGRGLQRGVYIQGAAPVLFAQLTIANGNAPQSGGFIASGGGIYSTSSVLTLVNVVVANNQASAEGGGVHAPSVIIRNARFVGNSGTSGGGLYAIADIIDASFEGNTGDLGGGLFARRANLENIRLINNTATMGGGMYVSESAILTRTTFIANRAAAGGGGMLAETGPIRIVGGRFESNRTDESFGGGLRVMGDLQLFDTVVKKNTALGRGGGLAQGYPTSQTHIVGGSFEENEAAEDGGGLWIAGNVVLEGTQVLGNRAGLSGGGLYQDNDISGPMRHGQLTAIATTFERNQATEDGGGLYIKGQASLHLDGTRVANNSAGMNGGGLARRGHNSEYIGPIDLNGGEFVANTAQRSGGGIFVTNSILLTRTQLLGNIAESNGGGLLVAAGDATLVNSLLGNNRASTAGDGIYLENRDGIGNPVEDSQIRLVNVTIASATRAPHAAIQVLGTQASLSLINTAVVSHTVGITRSVGSSLAGDYNAFFGNTTNQKVGNAAVALSFAHVVTSDPRFAGPSKHNFHLQANSPLVNTGDPSRNYSGQRDIDGERVPVGGRAEIGADEYYPYRILLPMGRR
jgi:predicted outer membrane repeat protein